MMRVLIACEFSAVVREAFRARGHDAWSCDLLPSEQPGQHIQGDVLTVGKSQSWDLIISHSPCRFLSLSGVRWLYQHGRRWNKDGSENPIDAERWSCMVRDAKLFRSIGELPCERIARENSEMHSYALKIVGRKEDQIIQPWQFGHGETKASYYWLKNLPPLTPTKIVEGRTARVHREAPSPDRWKNRSRTLQGIANAMAEQWG